MYPSPKNQPAGQNETGPTKEPLVKIDTAIKSIPAPRGKDTKSAVSRLLQPADPAAVSDDVRLTETSEKMRQLETDLSNIDITDAAKVESIRQAIEDGNFRVDEEAVAEGLIQESIATIGRRSRQ
jgi:negative regulator of flagellin synthesis FlgM